MRSHLGDRVLPVDRLKADKVANLPRWLGMVQNGRSREGVKVSFRVNRTFLTARIFTEQLPRQAPELSVRVPPATWVSCHWFGEQAPHHRARREAFAKAASGLRKAAMLQIDR